MMNCPLCGSSCQALADSQTNSIKYVCSRFNRSFKVGSSVDIFRDDNLQRKLNNLIFEKVMNEPYADEEKTFWWFYYEPSYTTKEGDKYSQINLAELAYPQNLSEKIDRVLLNLYHINQSYGYLFQVNSTLSRAFFAETDDEEKTIGLSFLMVELEYLFPDSGNFYKIAAKGWQRIDELLRKSSEKKQAFIAMAFRDETKPIRQAFREAIIARGFTPLTIDEKEHNNQIVPEILHEIEKSSFLVMDATVPNFGAYYEAGYALGKGKQVIICCSEESFKSDNRRPHFDIAQKSMVVWRDYKDLVEKLIKRIEATVPEE